MNLSSFWMRLGIGDSGKIRSSSARRTYASMPAVRCALLMDTTLAACASSMIDLGKNLTRDSGIHYANLQESSCARWSCGVTR